MYMCAHKSVKKQKVTLQTQNDVSMIYIITSFHCCQHTGVGSAQYDHFEQFYIKDYKCAKKMIKSMMLGFEWL